MNPRTTFDQGPSDDWWSEVFTSKEHKELERVSQEIIDAQHEAEDWVLLPVGVSVAEFNTLLNALHDFTEGRPHDQRAVVSFITKLVMVMALEYSENDMIEPDEGSTQAYRQYYNPEFYEDDEDDGD